MLMNIIMNIHINMMMIRRINSSLSSKTYHKGARGLGSAREQEVRDALDWGAHIVAARDIPAGTPFSAENLTVKRPGTGVSPMRWDSVLGTRASRNYRKDDLINA